VSRHIILVRHGQYDETQSESSGERKLTALGRRQAELTGDRLRAMVNALGERGRLRSIIVSDLTRAKETAAIVHERLGDSAVPVGTPDPNLNEGRPAIPVPSKRGAEYYGAKVYRDGARIEAAFRSYVKRAMPTKDPIADDDNAEGAVGSPVRHEFDVIVCHGNVIRFFVMRALQLPPQAWLRLCFFNCSLTCLTVRPSGHVSLRYAGDVGHLREADVTYGSHEGWTW
jgi:serine/threonine-protein phosphatase PGAM5